MTSPKLPDFLTLTPEPTPDAPFLTGSARRAIRAAHTAAAEALEAHEAADQALRAAKRSLAATRRADSRAAAQARYEAAQAAEAAAEAAYYQAYRAYQRASGLDLILGGSATIAAANQAAHEDLIAQGARELAASDEAEAAERAHTAAQAEIVIAQAEADAAQALTDRLNLTWAAYQANEADHKARRAFNEADADYERGVRVGLIPARVTGLTYNRPGLVPVTADRDQLSRAAEAAYQAWADFVGSELSRAAHQYKADQPVYLTPEAAAYLSGPGSLTPQAAQAEAAADKAYEAKARLSPANRHLIGDYTTTQAAAEAAYTQAQAAAEAAYTQAQAAEALIAHNPLLTADEAADLAQAILKAGGRVVTLSRAAAERAAFQADAAGNEGAYFELITAGSKSPEAEIISLTLTPQAADFAERAQAYWADLTAEAEALIAAAHDTHDTAAATLTAEAAGIISPELRPAAERCYQADPADDTAAATPQPELIEIITTRRALDRAYEAAPEGSDLRDQLSWAEAELMAQRRAYDEPGRLIVTPELAAADEAAERARRAEIAQRNLKAANGAEIRAIKAPSPDDSHDQLLSLIDWAQTLIKAGLSPADEDHAKAMIAQAEALIGPKALRAAAYESKALSLIEFVAVMIGETDHAEADKAYEAADWGRYAQALSRAAQAAQVITALIAAQAELSGSDRAQAEALIDQVGQDQGMPDDADPTYGLKIVTISASQHDLYQAALIADYDDEYSRAYQARPEGLSYYQAYPVTLSPEAAQVVTEYQDYKAAEAAKAEAAERAEARRVLLGL